MKNLFLIVTVLGFTLACNGETKNDSNNQDSTKKQNDEQVIPCGPAKYGDKFLAAHISIGCDKLPDAHLVYPYVSAQGKCSKTKMHVDMTLYHVTDTSTGIECDGLRVDEYEKKVQDKN